MASDLLNFFTCGAGSFVPARGVFSLLTLDARSAYPWPLCWGNALWGYVAYRMYRDTQRPIDRPGLIFAIGISYLLYTMPANIFTNLLILGRMPAAFTSSLCLPAHLVAVAIVDLCPGAYNLLSSTFGLAFIDTLGVLDNVTTGLNFLEETYKLTGSPIAAIAAAMTTNLGGGIARHFATRGYTEGASSFDEKFATNVIYSLVTNCLYFALAVAACAPVAVPAKRGKGVVMETPSCDIADMLYMALPLVACVKNLLPFVVDMRPLKHKSATTPMAKRSGLHGENGNGKSKAL